MTEADAVALGAQMPVTIESLAHALAAIGLRPGMVVLGHSALSRLGWVCGGPVAVIQALQAVLTPDGTLVMPTHSADLSEPGRWENPQVPAAWWPIIRAEMPAFDPDLTPTRGMGKIPETFRKGAGVRRSYHPEVSFAAWGRHAEEITAGHELEFGLGEGSPLARIYDLGGHVLLLGVGHEHNTSLHLAEHRANWPGRRTYRGGAPVMRGGERIWATFDDLECDAEDFPAIGALFASTTGLVRMGAIGSATATLLPQRQLVDFATKWITANRN